MWVGVGVLFACFAFLTAAPLTAHHTWRHTGYPTAHSHWRHNGRMIRAPYLTPNFMRGPRITAPPMQASSWSPLSWITSAIPSLHSHEITPIAIESKQGPDLSGFVVGHASDRHLSGANAFHEKVQIPESFDCGGQKFKFGMENWSPGQDSVTATYTNQDGETFFAKFAMESSDSQDPRSLQNLITELRVLRHLEVRGVPHVVRVTAACQLDDGTVVLVEPRVIGRDIQPNSYTRAYELDQPKADDEEGLVRNTLSTALQILRAGIVNNDQYHNILINGRDPTFIDFGAARVLEEQEEPAKHVMRWFQMFFSMIPERQVDGVNAMLGELLHQTPIPGQFGSAQLVLRLWHHHATKEPDPSLEEEWEQRCRERSHTK